MKTNQFENTIRRKLESIQPDFQEEDWGKMQRYMHANTPPSLWQQYGSWIGYAAAATVTAVMAFLYANQVSHNNHLEADVRNLQSQIAGFRQQPAPQAPSRTDTIYVVQSIPTTPERSIAKRVIAPVQAGLQRAEIQIDKANTIIAANAEDLSSSHIRADFGSFELKEPVHTGSQFSNRREMSYSLASRLSTRQVQRILAQNQPQPASNAAATKKPEKIAKAESVVPKLDIKVPYRFGGGIQFDGNGQTKSIVGEVIVGKRFSIATGISWLKVKPMEFFTEKVFRDKVRRDFKRSHPGDVPLALDVYNIKVKPTLVQIPLTVAFRNNLKDNWAYYGAVGTNINLSSREQISFDCVTPNKEVYRQDFDRKSETPVINSMNFTAGIEKQWHPVVVQAEGFLYTYFTPLSPLSHNAGPGVRVKLLYQIGGKM